MVSKNSETPLCANTNGVSNVSNPYEKTNMNMVAKSDYNFQGFTFHPVEDSGSVWFASTELAKALGYKKTDAISQIYARNADEFSESMSLTLNMKVNGINNSLRNKSVRVYSLRGAHLVAMFATTTKAKEFRKWVLDILDKEAAKPIVKMEPEKKTYQHPASIDRTDLIFKLDMMNTAWNAAYKDVKAEDPRMAEYLNRIMGTIVMFTMDVKSKIPKNMRDF